MLTLWNPFGNLIENPTRRTTKRDDIAYDPFAWFYEQTESLTKSIVDTEEKDGKVLYFVDLPGVKKEDVSLNLEGNLIRVSATRKNRNSSASFSTSFTLPQSVDTQTIDAELADGVLTIFFNKKELPKSPEPKQIIIR